MIGVPCDSERAAVDHGRRRSARAPKNKEIHCCSQKTDVGEAVITVEYGAST